MASWQYQGKDFEEMAGAPVGTIGFLYKITNKETGQYYFGRRLFTKSSVKMVNGKKKKIRKENDWKDYWSSNNELKEIAKTNPEILERKILIFVPTLGAMTAGEEYLLYVSGALFDPLCYNKNIRAKIFSTWFTKIPDFWPELKSVDWK